MDENFDRGRSAVARTFSEVDPMNARAIFLIGTCAAVGFAAGHFSRNPQVHRALGRTTESSGSSRPAEDLAGSALAELSGGKDLASLVRLGTTLDRLDSEQMKK